MPIHPPPHLNFKLFAWNKPRLSSPHPFMTVALNPQLQSPRIAVSSLKQLMHKTFQSGSAKGTWAAAPWMGNAQARGLGKYHSLLRRYLGIHSVLYTDQPKPHSGTKAGETSARPHTSYGCQCLRETCWVSSIFHRVGNLGWGPQRATSNKGTGNYSWWQWQTLPYKSEIFIYDFRSFAIMIKSLKW